MVAQHERDPFGIGREEHGGSLERNAEAPADFAKNWSTGGDCRAALSAMRRLPLRHVLAITKTTPLTRSGIQPPSALL